MDMSIRYLPGRNASPSAPTLRLVREHAPRYDGAPRVDGDAAAAPSEVDPQVALTALHDAVELLARADLSLLDDRELLEHTVAVDREVTRAQSQVSRALATIDVRNAFVEDACVSPASWWRMRTHRDHATAARTVRAARRLRTLDATRQAFEDGAITTAHVEVIAGAATPRRHDAIVDHEDTLVTLAKEAPPMLVARACRRIADLVDADGIDDPGPADRRAVWLARVMDDRGDLRADLEPMTRARLERLLDVYDPPLPDDRRTPAQRRHDAFDAMLRAAEEHPGTPSVHGAKPHALLIMDLLTLLGRPDLASRSTRLDDGTPLELDQALSMLQAANVTPVLTMGPYRVVGVGRTHRTLPAWLRPLLKMIHGTCRGPGCDRPFAWTQAAHEKAWAKGGETDLDQTIPACPGHHKLMDIAGWTVEVDPDTAICTWTSPDGRTIRTTHPPDT